MRAGVRCDYVADLFRGEIDFKKIVGGVMATRRRRATGEMRMHAQAQADRNQVSRVASAVNYAAYYVRNIEQCSERVPDAVYVIANRDELHELPVDGFRIAITVGDLDEYHTLGRAWVPSSAEQTPEREWENLNARHQRARASEISRLSSVQRREDQIREIEDFARRLQEETQRLALQRLMPPVTDVDSVAGRSIKKPKRKKGKKGKKLKPSPPLRHDVKRRVRLNRADNTD